MVQFMLDNLGGKARKGGSHLLPILIAVANHNVLIASGWPAADQRQTEFCCLIRFGLADEDGIIQDQVTKAQADNDNPLLNPNHIGCQAYTGILMGQQGVLQILPYGQVSRTCLLGFLLEKENVCYYWLNHGSTSLGLV